MILDPSKYVVLDVETNGLLSSKNDLLSISLYLPDKDLRYERFFPLNKDPDLNPNACKINGITKKMLIGKSHLTQEEFNSIAFLYGLFDREILHFGKLDKGFIRNYLSEHKIKGYNKLKFHDIKHHFITNSFSNGEYSKDNLCIALGIDGVSKIHSGINDCILEWKLFEKINGNFILCKRLGNYKIGLFQLPNDFYVPVSYIRYYPNFKHAICLPAIMASYEEIYRLDLSQKCKNEYLSSAYQPAGFAAEKIIWKLLNAKDVVDDTFAKRNFEKLIKIGEFRVEPEYIIDVTINDDGTLKSVNDENKAYVDAMNKQMLAIKSEISPLINFLKEEIFDNEEILTQEVIINNNLKAFGNCDFSNKTSCLEMKFGNQFFDEVTNKINKTKLDQHKYQYFVTSNGRYCYLLIGAYFTFRIYKVSFEIGDSSRKRIVNWHTGKAGRKVEMYDIDGNYIKTFNSYLDAMEEIKIAKTTLLDNCRGKVKLTKGYQFKFCDTDKKIGPVLKRKNNNNISRKKRTSKAVIQYNLKYGFVAEYKSLKEAEKITGILASKISMVCNLKRQTAGGYKWKYK